jgi:hypothetical protein
VTPGIDYKFAILAINELGEGPQSDSCTITPMIEEVPIVPVIHREEVPGKPDAPLEV